MRARGVVASSLLLLLLLTPALASAGPKKKAKPAPSPSPAAAATPAATPTPAALAATPTPAPVATPVDETDLPTVADDPASDSDLGGRRSSGMMLGLRGGFHSFDFSGGGATFEVTGALPWKGPWWIGALAGYHTGTMAAGADKQSRFFDAEYGGVELQHRGNAGSLNLFEGIGLGVLDANSSLVTLPDGSPAGVTGLGPAAWLLGGVHVPMGRVGLVGQARYAFAPVDFRKTKQTLMMGGLSVAAGVDFGF